ncbi:NADH:ubiquinone reductase (Na(+)-transporting) subunit C [Bacteroidota bacterium]
MRSFSNTYIFVFSLVMVVIVAVLLSFVAMQLKPLQDMNVEIEKKGDILRSVGEASDLSEVKDKNSFINEEFTKYITDSYVVNYDGEVIEEDAFEITLNMKVQADKEPEDRFFPVFMFKGSDGADKYIVPVRGKGLWGPIWGYISFEPDMNTIYGAIFDHQGETPGLGAEINTDWFEGKFKGKQIFDASGNFVSVEVIKGGTPDSNLHGVDAISGGTITSVGLSDMLSDYLVGYVNHFKQEGAK